MRCCAIDRAPLSISGCPGCVTVVGDVVFAVLGHLDYVHQRRGKEVKEESSVSEGWGWEVCVCIVSACGE